MRNAPRRLAKLIMKRSGGNLGCFYLSTPPEFIQTLWNSWGARDSQAFDPNSGWSIII